MKRFFILLSIAAFFGSCLSDDSGDPGKPGTYVRYFYGGYNDNPVAFEITADKGFIILSTVTISASEAVSAKYKIKLTKTDEFGNPLWQKTYPDFSAGSATIDYKAKGMQILSGGGYVITGEDIQSTVSKILIMTVDDQGTILKQNSIPSPGSTPSAYGQAVATNAAGNYLVLSGSPALNTDGDAEMILTEFKKDDLTPLWSRTYGAGPGFAAPRLFLDNGGKLFWAGTAKKFNITAVRLVKAGQNVQNVDFDLFMNNTPFTEEAADMCRFGDGYAMIGTTNNKGNPTPGDKDINFTRVDQSGIVSASKSYPLDSKDIVDTQNDQGNSICSTSDGGLILLGTVGSLAVGGRGENDYMLIKIDPFGDFSWKISFGSRFKDQGVFVRQTSDGGYAVLGLSTQGGKDLMVLTKTDKLGRIE